MFDFSQATSLFVSPSKGSDENTGLHPTDSGAFDGPLRSVGRALAIVTEMRRAGMLQPVTVKITEDVFLDRCVTVKTDPTAYRDPAVLTDVTIESYGGRRLISGGRKMTGWKRDVFNGVDCLSVFLQDVKDGRWDFKDLYVKNDFAETTRYPESGYLAPEDVENHGGHPHADKSRWIIAKEGDIPADMKNPGDVTLSFCHYWIDEHTPIKEFDRETRKLTLKYPTAMTVTTDGPVAARMKYWLDNVAEAFSKPGQWYLDRPEGMLYYIPREGETADDLEVFAPVCERLFDFKGDVENGLLIRGVRLRDLSFAYTKSDYVTADRFFIEEDGTSVPVASDGQSWHGLHGAINFFGCSGCSVEDSDVFCSGSNGVAIEAGCDHIRIDGVTVKNCGGGGVKVNGGGDPAKPGLHTHDVTVTDCTLCDLGKKYLASDGVLITNACDCEVSHNDIHGLYYSGVCVGWIWGYKPSVTRGNRITKNLIYDLGRGVLSDMGGVYLLGGQPGTVVSGNVIHDVRSRDYGGWGLYTDEGSAYILLENNVCYNMSQHCYHQHYGMMNTVRNNIFVGADKAAIAVTKHEGHKGLLFENNIVVLKEGRAVYSHATPAVVSSDRNLIWDESGKEPIFAESEGQKQGSGETRRAALSHEDVKARFGFDTESKVADPLFRDAENRDFSLRKDSPAFALGFKPIDTSDVGPRKQKKRR